MRRHLRIAALVGTGFLLLVLAVVVGDLGPTGRAVGLILGIVGLLTVVLSGAVYTVLFVRDLFSPQE